MKYLISLRDHFQISLLSLREFPCSPEISKKTEQFYLMISRRTEVD